MYQSVSTYVPPKQFAVQGASSSTLSSPRMSLVGVRFFLYLIGWMAGAGAPSWSSSERTWPSVDGEEAQEAGGSDEPPMGSSEEHEANSHGEQSSQGGPHGETELARRTTSMGNHS